MAAWAHSYERVWAEEPAVRAATAALLLLILALPLLLVVLGRIPLTRRLADAIGGQLQRRWTLALLLLMLVLVQLSYLSRGSDYRVFALPLTVILLALVAVWAYVPRDAFRPEEVVPFALWFAALVFTRVTLQHAMGTIDLQHASWRGAGLFAYFALALAAVVAAPFCLMLMRPDSRPLISLMKAARHGTIPLGLTLVATLLLLGLSQVGAYQGVRLDLALEAAALAGLLLLGWMSLNYARGYLPVPGPSSEHAKADIPIPLYRVGLMAIGVAYLALAASLRTPSQINPDGLAYFTIARSIAAGQWVVRGFWSPLMSWLLAPAIALGADPYSAFQVLQRVYGLAWVWLAVALSRRAGLSRAGQLSLAIVIALIALSRTLHPVTPDLLGAVLLSAYFVHVAGPAFSARPVRNGAIAGLLGALASYAKYYNFPFFIAHCAVSALLLRWTDERPRAVIKAFASALITFFLLTTPYALALAGRYGNLTFTTSAWIARATFGPSSTGYPCWDGRLCPLPEDVLFPWEDPLGRYYPDLGWSPLESPSALAFQVRQAWSNITQWLSVALGDVGPLPALSLGALGLVALLTLRKGRTDPLPLWALVTVVLYASGYFLTSSEPFRFFLSTLSIHWIVVYKLVTDGRFAGLVRPSRRWVASAVCAGVLALPILTFLWFGPLRESLTLQDEPCIERGAMALASTLEEPFVGTDALANHVAYYTGLRTIGVLPSGLNAQEVDALVRPLHVRSILASADSDVSGGLRGLGGYRVLAVAPICEESYIVLEVGSR